MRKLARRSCMMRSPETYIKDPSLSGPRASKDGRNRLGKNLQVQPERPLIQIFEIQEHPLVEGDSAAAIYLPETGYAGFDAESPALPIFIETLIVTHR